MTAAPLSERVLAGDARAIARAISLIEDEAPAGAELVRRIFASTGRAYLIGVTGPPGAGKSTLVDRLIGDLRAAGSDRGRRRRRSDQPFTGGAILGDRVRMQAHAGDAGVFIRSMATRGHLGGLARATGEAALVLDAAGRDVVLIETVGVGQDEVDIVRTADVSIVTLVPGDRRRRAGAQGRHHGDRGHLRRQQGRPRGRGPHGGLDRSDAVAAHRSAGGRVAAAGPQDGSDDRRGVAELLEAIERFRAHTRDGAGQPPARARGVAPARAARRSGSSQHVERDGARGRASSTASLERIAAREVDPYTAVDDIFGGRCRRALSAAARVRRALRPTASARTVMKAILDHVGIAVANVSEALAFYRDALGLEIEAPEEVASQRVRAHFIPTPARRALELLEADGRRLADRASSCRSAAPACITSRCGSTTSPRRWRS